MQLLQDVQLEVPSPCPYLAGRERCYQTFLAHQVGPEELGRLLKGGWRKFGPQFFRPACDCCRQCIPLRIPTREFAPSRSQRRVLRRNRDLRTTFGPLRPNDKIFSIYRDHARERFGDTVSWEEFLCLFYLPSCPSQQIEIFLGDRLIAVGFLDFSAHGLSSVYFCFDPEFSRRSLGTYSILQEIAHARQLGLEFYYLGYFVPGCPRMAYKDRFHPREHFHWDSSSWLRPEEIAPKQD